MLVRYTLGLHSLRPRPELWTVRLTRTNQFWSLLCTVPNCAAVSSILTTAEAPNKCTVHKTMQRCHRHARGRSATTTKMKQPNRSSPQTTAILTKPKEPAHATCAYVPSMRAHIFNSAHFVDITLPSSDSLASSRPHSRPSTDAWSSRKTKTKRWVGGSI